MVNVAIAGFGVVGSGVAEILRKNGASIEQKSGKKIVLKKILDIRDFEENPYSNFLTKNPDEVFLDDSIKILVETIGGIDVAYDFTKRAINAGKHVVTSNKELVATHGSELLKLAKEKGVNYLFEASVGGGIPIIKPLSQCLAANEISAIEGILNGTTNYILTRMKRDLKNFYEALEEAKEKGYAESDPTADIEGHDACRKIAILSSIAFSEYVDYRKIQTEGICGVSLIDLEYADYMGATIKLLASSKKIDDKIQIRVCPAIIFKTHPLYGVEDVFNAIVVKGDAIGEAMFYGKGAGKLPTASAVVADIIEITKSSEPIMENIWKIKDKDNIIDNKNSFSRFFIRTSIFSSYEAEKIILNVFGKVEFVSAIISNLKDEIAFVTLKEREEVLMEKIEKIKTSGYVKEVQNIIRVEEN